MEKQTVEIARRDTRAKSFVAWADTLSHITSLLTTIQVSLRNESRKKNVTSFTAVSLNVVLRRTQDVSRSAPPCSNVLPLQRFNKSRDHTDFCHGCNRMRCLPKHRKSTTAVKRQRTHGKNFRLPWTDGTWFWPHGEFCVFSSTLKYECCSDLAYEQLFWVSRGHTSLPSLCPVALDSVLVEPSVVLRLLCCVAEVI